MVEHSTLWLAKVLGAIAGAFGSVVFFVPRDRRDAFYRFAAGVPMGIIFGPLAASYLNGWVRIDLLSPVEQVLIGSTTASLLIWVVTGALYSWIRAKGGGGP